MQTSKEIIDQKDKKVKIDSELPVLIKLPQCDSTKKWYEHPESGEIYQEGLDNVFTRCNLLPSCNPLIQMQRQNGLLLQYNYIIGNHEVCIIRPEEWYRQSSNWYGHRMIPNKLDSNNR